MAGFSTEGIMPVMPYGMGNQGDGFGFGNGGGWIVFLIIAMMFGWGGNGYGFNGKNGFAGGELFTDQFALQDLKNGQRQIDSGLRGIERGVCDSSYALNSSIQGLGSQLSNCCCGTNRNIDSVRYENAKNTCEIITNNNMNTRNLIEAGNANTQRIVDILTQNTIQNLRDKNQALSLSALLQQQTTNITNITNPRVVPSYPVCNPYEVLYNFNGYGNCGC